MNQKKNKIKLDELIEKLIQEGDDEKELRYWQGIFDIMEKEQQDELIACLEEEIKEIEKIKKDK